MPIRIRRTFDRKSIRRGLAGVALLWQRVETRWDENPGYVAATTAGTIGILLALSLMVSAGFDWFNGPLDEQPPGVTQADPDDDLGDPGDAVMRGLRRVDEEDETPYQFANRRDDSVDSGELGEPDDADDPFMKPKQLERSDARDVANETDGDEPAADEPDDFRPPARRAIVERTPKLQIVIEEEDEDEDPPPEPTAPNINFGLADAGRDEDVIEKEMAADGDEPELPTTEPAFLKTNGELDDDVKQPEKSRRIEPDDDVLRREARPARQLEPEPKPEISKPEIHRPRMEQPAAREQSRWQQQRTRAETPAAELRQSRTTETIVVAPREAPPARRTVTTPAPREQNLTPKSSADEPFRMSIAGPAHVGLGESCSYVLTVSNTGSTTARNLVVSIELPPGLVHEVSQSLEQNVDSIPPGGSHRSLLRLCATKPGQSTIDAEIVAGHRVAAKLTARVQVGSTASARVVMSECCDDVR